MAVATLVSRLSGFAGKLLLAWVIGFGVLNDSYTVANTLPNIVYELLLGGVLTSVVVPLLVRAARDDARLACDGLAEPASAGRLACDGETEAVAVTAGAGVLTGGWRGPPAAAGGLTAAGVRAGAGGRPVEYGESSVGLARAPTSGQPVPGVAQP